MLSIIIPAHNEEHRIGPTLKDLARFMKQNKGKLGDWANYHVIVISDGTDSTPSVAFESLKEAGQGHRLKLIEFGRRQGKGAAVKAGLLASRGDALIYDADGSTPPKEIPKLRNAIASGADVAIGSRAIVGSRINAHPPMARRAASKFFNIIARKGFGLHFADTQCGFKAISEKVSHRLGERLWLNGFEWDVQLLREALNLGYKVVEVPVSWTHSEQPRAGASGPATAAGMVFRLGHYKLKGTKRQ